MNDPRFHPYPSIGYRAPVHAFRPQGMQRQFGGPPQGRLIGRPPRQAAGRRMGHLPPCVTNQGEEIGYPPKFSGPYPGGINAQGPAFNHHARAMGRSPSRFRGPGGGPRGRRGLRCSTKQESVEEATMTTVQPTLRTLETSKPTSSVGKVPSSEPPDVKCKDSEATSQSKKDEGVQTYSKLSSKISVLGGQSNQSQPPGDKQTAKIEPFRHTPNSGSTEAVCASSTSFTTKPTSTEPSYTTIVHIAPDHSEPWLSNDETDASSVATVPASGTDVSSDEMDEQCPVTTVSTSGTDVLGETIDKQFPVTTVSTSGTDGSGDEMDEQRPVTTVPTSGTDVLGEAIDKEIPVTTVSTSGTGVSGEVMDVQCLGTTAPTSGTDVSVEATDVQGLVTAVTTSGTCPSTDEKDIQGLITTAPTSGANVSGEAMDVQGLVTTVPTSGTRVSTDEKDVHGLITTAPTSGTNVPGEAMDVQGLVTTVPASGTRVSTDEKDACPIAAAAAPVTCDLTKETAECSIVIPTGGTSDTSNGKTVCSVTTTATNGTKNQTAVCSSVPANGTYSATANCTLCQCCSIQKQRLREKYGSKGCSTTDPIVIDSDEDDKPAIGDSSSLANQKGTTEQGHCRAIVPDVIDEAEDSGSISSPSKKRAKMSAYAKEEWASVPPKEESKVSILAEMAPAPPEDPMEDSEELSLANISGQISDQLQQGHISAKIDIGSSSSQPAFASSSSSNISSSSSSSIGSSSSISSTSSAPGATNNAQVSGEQRLLGNPQLLNSILAEVKQEKPPKKFRLTARNLYMAVKCRNVAKVMSMLREGCNPNQQVDQEKGKSAMHAAAAADFIDILGLLRNSNGDFNILDYSGRSPIFEAIENRKVQSVKFLLEGGASLRIRDEDGMTCLHVASRRGFTDLISLLCETGQVDVNQKDKGGWTSIMWAADDKHTGATRRLIEMGANVHLRDLELNTPLHWAACAGVQDVSELLLNNNADVNSQNEHGDTPLHIAAREGRYACVQLYSYRGARLDVKNKHGETPVEVSPERSRCYNFLESKRLMLASQWPHKFTLLSSDISRGREHIAITCVNEVDDEPMPIFNYVPVGCEPCNVRVDVDIKSLERCDCEDNCRSGVCSCSQKGDGERIWYKWSDQHGTSLLEPGILEFDRPLVYECNRMCRCWTYCQNRVVQKGMKFPLQVFRTKHKAWGVRSLGPIPAGAFVCEYSGEWISDAEADERSDDSYLFDLDCKENEDDLHCIDAKVYGNVGRFINHSCEPNVTPVRVFIEHQDIRFPRIGMFASRDIGLHDEICFDYGDRFWKVKRKEFRCWCGTPSCKYKGP